MPSMEASIYTGKAVEKNLTLVFDEDDDVIHGLRQAIKQHNIRECTAVEADGLLKEAVIQYFIHNRFTSTELKNGRIVSCSGRFMNLQDGIYGDLHVGFMLGMQMWDGTLVKGKAMQGFSLTLKFNQPVVANTPTTGIGSIQN